MSPPGTIVRAVGALVEAYPMPKVALHELVHVGPQRLMGEVLRVDGGRATIQVFEDTGGLALGMSVTASGRPHRVKLGPGLLGRAFDGTGRPLTAMAQQQGSFVSAGSDVPTLNPEDEWVFRPERSVGESVGPGDILGTVQENESVVHKVMVPSDIHGNIRELREGPTKIDDVIGVLEDGTELNLFQWWTIRHPRPVGERTQLQEPFITGQRIFDFLFPVTVGGTIAVPGGFGTGKTVIEQALAKYSHADIVVYIGCGERGNEMAEVLSDFGSLSDPRTGRSLLERTVLVVNTSNMPVVARETSIYLGMSIAEYFRDMGYRVAVMADSLSRWAEALREIGSRAQEMPGEEGYPTSLGNRLAKIFERSGAAELLGTPPRSGAVTFIAAISPPGGDFSEPVTQGALRVAGALWALDPTLAHQRQFPAVSWEASYSLYGESAARWFGSQVDPGWARARADIMRLLERDRELREIVGLVGPEALEDADRVLLEAASLAKSVVLGQSAFDPHDAYSTVEKTFALARLTLDFLKTATDAVETGLGYGQVATGDVRSAMFRVRDCPAAEFQEAVAHAEETLSKIQPKAVSP